MTNRPQVSVSMPPSRDGLPSAVKERIAEFERLRDEHHAASEKLYALERSRADVEQRDAAAEATALRAGKPATGQKHLEAYVAQVAATRHRTLALATALDSSGRDLIAGIEAEQPSIVEKAHRTVDTAEAGFAKAVGALEDAHQHMVAARSMRSWAVAFPERAKGAASAAIEVGAANGSPLPVDEVLAKLREVVAPRDHAEAA